MHSGQRMYVQYYYSVYTHILQYAYIYIKYEKSLSHAVVDFLRTRGFLVLSPGYVWSWTNHPRLQTAQIFFHADQQFYLKQFALRL